MIFRVKTLGLSFGLKNNTIFIFLRKRLQIAKCLMQARLRAFTPASFGKESYL